MNNTSIPTARALRESLEARGVIGPAADLMVKLTAPTRHEARVKAALAACDVDPTLKGEDAEIATVCLLDRIGVGGRAGLDGAGTSRHPALGAVGAASKQSGAGPAWTAAITEAALRAQGGRTLRVWPFRSVADGRTIIVLASLDPNAEADDPASTQVWSTEVLEGDDFAVVSPDRGYESHRVTRHWWAALAGIAVARLSGVAPDMRKEALVGVRVEGDIALWASLYGACVAPEPEVPESPEATAEAPADEKGWVVLRSVSGGEPLTVSRVHADREEAENAARRFSEGDDGHYYVGPYPAVLA